MDAIRKAGGTSGAGLKKANKRKEETKKKIKEEKSTGGGGGGDLMGDLFAKLSMRRKGISGTKQAGDGGGGDKSESAGGGNAMDKINSMIPPPPKPHAGSVGPGDEDDWE